MYIRRTHTNNSSTGERYFTYRLVKSERVSGTVNLFYPKNLLRLFFRDNRFNVFYMVYVGFDRWL